MSKIEMFKWITIVITHVTTVKLNGILLPIPHAWLMI